MNCSRVLQTQYRFDGLLGDYLEGVTRQWLLVAPKANPGMLEMFRDRDRLPRRNMVPWAGEFAGKYLTSTVQVLRLTGDEDLWVFVQAFVKQLVSLQAKDGYLGPWPVRFRLTGKAPNVMNRRGTWDAWGHYHVMLGLLLWYEDTGDREALNCVRRIGDLVCWKFAGRKRTRLVDTGSTDKNLAIIHSLCLLYRHVANSKYLEMALQILDEFEAKDNGEHLAGDYLRTALVGQEFYQTPFPRWESLHAILGMLELYRLTGNEDCRKAFEHIWWSIVKLDRHNNGGFSSGEKAQGNPYHRGAIETCCTIAWIAMSVEMLRLTGHSVVADELELSTLNSVLGFHSHTGRWVTYNTPMDGVRKASAHDIVFQSREGTPELNCCSVNGPRGIGMVDDWALMSDADGLILNWYGPSEMRTVLSDGREVLITQETEYPRKGTVCVVVTPDQTSKFILKLRIPYWSTKTSVTVNGKRVRNVSPGTYLTLDRRWKRGDTVRIALDMTLHFWVGEKESRGRVSIFRGPILLTYDRRFNELDPAQIPELDAGALQGRLAKSRDWIRPFLLFDCVTHNNQKVRLCDFASAGEGGSPYVSWLKVKGVEKTPFSTANPLRSGRP